MKKQSKAKITEIIFGEAAFFTALLVLVAVGAFFLGRMTERGVFSEQTPQAAAVIKNTNEQSGVVIASRTGSVYHLPWCSGALTIEAQNKITFTSAEDAKAAGYRPAKNCKGIR